MIGSYMTHAQAFFPGIHERQHAIVWRDKVLPLRTGQNWAASASHSWINHDQMDGAGRKVRISLGQSQRAVKNVESLHRMADIHDLGFRRDTQNRALDGANKMIVQAKVGGQGDNRAFRQVSLTRYEVWIDSKVMVLQGRVKVRW